MIKVREPLVRDIFSDSRFKMPVEALMLEKQRFEIELRDFTVIYTPILARK